MFIDDGDTRYQFLYVAGDGHLCGTLVLYQTRRFDSFVEHAFCVLQAQVQIVRLGSLYGVVGSNGDRS